MAPFNISPLHCTKPLAVAPATWYNILALGVRPNNPLEETVKAMGIPVQVIGDACKPGPANKATEAALEAVLAL